MKIKIIVFLLLMNSILQAQPPSATEKKQIAIKMEESLENDLLNKWYPQSIDTVFGGFLSTFTYDLKPTGNQQKMIVTQARHTWVNAKAALRYPDKSFYRTDASIGYKFLIEKMWDHQYGGFFTLVDRNGELPAGSPGNKEAYGNAFGIYALSAYYEMTRDTSVLVFAKKSF